MWLINPIVPVVLNVFLALIAELRLRTEVLREEPVDEVGPVVLVAELSGPAREALVG